MKKEEVEPCSCNDSGIVDHLQYLCNVHDSMQYVTMRSQSSNTLMSRLLDFHSFCSAWLGARLLPPEWAYHWQSQHLAVKFFNSIITGMRRFIETLEVTCSFYTFTLNMRKWDMERGSSMLKGMRLPQGHIACLPRGSNSWQWPILLRSSDSAQIFQGVGFTTYMPEETADLVSGICLFQKQPAYAYFLLTCRLSHNPNQMHLGEKAHPKEVLLQWSKCLVLIYSTVLLFACPVPPPPSADLLWVSWLPFVRFGPPSSLHCPRIFFHLPGFYPTSLSDSCSLSLPQFWVVIFL